MPSIPFASWRCRPLAMGASGCALPAGGQALAHEFMQIRAGAADQLALIAEPSGRRHTACEPLTR